MKKGKDNTPFIGIFGRRNFGKSTLVNRLAGQDIAIVSDVAGTTTDPVRKTVEVPGIGPVVFVDTAGIDDTGALGQMRIDKTFEAIKQIDLAILVVSANEWGSYEADLLHRFADYKLPFVLVYSKADLSPISAEFAAQLQTLTAQQAIEIRPDSPESTAQLVTRIRSTLPESIFQKKSLVGGLVSYGDVVLLITPIDIEAPEGRLILPQVQTIRDVLDNDCISIVLKEREVDAFLRKTGIRPKLAVTDSQIFLKADASIPRDIPLTSFSILLARLKGDFEHYLQGTPAIDKLQDGDTILLLESCTHQVSCDDIGRVKIPRWITNYTGKKLNFEVVAGLEALQKPIETYSLVVQCGGCVVTQKQLQSRLKSAIDRQIPVTNYGMTIAYVQGIYHRAVEPFLNQQTTPDTYL